tara:strand:- start:82 stop:846 length:765 start_codon:yes stop_codon:yes gene_type:complete
MMFLSSVESIFITNGVITAFLFVGLIIWFSYFLSNKLTKGKFHGSAIAIIIGLILAYIGGKITGGSKGLADITIFSGLAILGGSMFRDFAIVATAYGLDTKELKKAGLAGILSLFIGVILSFTIGACVAIFYGYQDAISITTIGAGTVTFLVGPVTGTALGASSEVMALSIAAGIIKSILVMVTTPLFAPFVGLNNPRSALIYGGLMGTNSGVAAGLAATDPKLVPYGAMTATFYTGLGCLIVPTLLFLIVSLL